MNTTKEKYYRTLFAIAAIYDLVLGITFTFFPARIFLALGIADKMPVFGGYLTLLGAFVLVLGVAYALIAQGDLRHNADLIFIGALYKLAYASTAIFYWMTTGLPHVLFGALFGVADAIFFVLMAECYFAVKRETKG